MIGATLKSLIQRADPKAVADLQRKVNSLEQELAQARANLKLTSAAQGALHRRSDALRREHPELWNRFFTRQGEADRALQAHKKGAR
ncbi:hypothetical protein [Stutzerimonas stutzeri]|uniref:hypothetical protein n=1 Tax=Stutzerimonas stutzeri TaxID=316 RepID=UPI00083870BB|nr:hypothetical protein [Stutzerimonas stutzeri]OCX57231.1 hypothetical protein BFM99_14265 [Stutzerimonas stutzeri]